MKFPNAQNGVKKIFTAEILSLIGGVALFAATVFGVTAVTIIENGKADEVIGATIGSSAGLIVFGIGAGVLTLIAFILNLVGIIFAMKDEEAFKTALIFAAFGIVASVLSSIFSKNETATSFIQIFKGLADLFVMYFVVEGIINLAKKLGDAAMAERGMKVRMLLCVSYCVPILINMVSGILSARNLSLIASTLALVAAVLSIFVYIFYLVYLSKAKKMLEA